VLGRHPHLYDRAAAVVARDCRASNGPLGHLEGVVAATVGDPLEVHDLVADGYVAVSVAGASTANDVYVLLCEEPRYLSGRRRSYRHGRLHRERGGRGAGDAAA
jgi:hypothetical protein